jgi:hypothetical protein
MLPDVCLYIYTYMFIIRFKLSGFGHKCDVLYFILSYLLDVQVQDTL